ncbi:MAG TPA: FtsX-like permease family protein, partial [Anaerolineales bacterium]
PLMISGRWFLPQDGRAIVIPRDTAEKNQLTVGDTVTLDLGVLGKDTWQIIGVYEPVFVGGFAAVSIYAPIESLFQITKKYNQAGALIVRTTAHDQAFTTQVTHSLKAAFEKHSLRVSSSQTQADLRATNEWQFSTVTYMLMALSIIVAIVGAFALMGAISIGVIERTKEIGVLRAIGARSPIILKIFVMEGLLQGLLSWLIAIPLSLLVSPFAASAMGNFMFGATLDYRYSWPAILIWLGIVAIISVLASILPARSATRISVRDSLAYA